MKTITKRITFLIVALMVMSIGVSAAKRAYAEMSYDLKTMTFKYGEKPNKMYCWDVTNTGSAGYPAWVDSGIYEIVTTVVFDPSFKEARPKSCRMWFWNFANLDSIHGINNLNTSEVTTMFRMFNSCINLRTLDVSGFNTSKVTDMEMMFIGCSKVKELDVRFFDVSKVTNMSQMFCGCNSLATIYCNRSWSCEQSSSMFWSSDVTPLKGAVALADDRYKTDVSMANPETGYFTYKHDYDIHITDYTLPQDFEPGDYEATSRTSGVKSVSVDYSMFDRSLDLHDAADVYAGSNLGIIFTIELEDAYGAANGVNTYNAYIDFDGEQQLQEKSVSGMAANKKCFVYVYRVPTPEGGEYMRTAIDTITAPVIGREPMWKIATSAGAKPIGILPEPTPKEQFQRDNYCPVIDIIWYEKGDVYEYDEEEGYLYVGCWKSMERGDKFQVGKTYAVELKISPVEGQQFHKRTIYKMNGENAVENVSFEYTEDPGAYFYCWNGRNVSLYYIFPTLPCYLGDVNMDGSITMADANAVVNYFLANEKPEGFPVHLANVNGDYDNNGNPAVTMADANQIVNSFLSGAAAQEYVAPDNGHE